jgi:hypothetical protein
MSKENFEKILLNIRILSLLYDSSLLQSEEQKIINDIIGSTIEMYNYEIMLFVKSKEMKDEK